MRRGLRGALTALAVATVVLPKPAGAVGLLPRPVSIAVFGNHLVDQFGLPVRLLGVNRDGAEWACVSNFDTPFDGPVDDNAIQAMADWNINVVRVPLNEDCWLGINGADPALSGPNYQAAIVDFVQRLHEHGLLAILDLHANAPGHALAREFEVMADHDHSPDFWRSVASTFKDDHAVLFDVFNEPHLISWDCWLSGCVTAGGWRAAGMQELVDTVRSTGATQPILLGGLQWSSDMTRWETYLPYDPAGQLVASVHLYDFVDCSSDGCWDATIAPIAEHYPVVTGEIGDSDCNHDFIDRYMAWADSQRISYLGWTWNTGGDWTCEGGPTLISDYDGTPSGMGVGLRDHLASLTLTEDAERVLSAL